MTDIKTGPNPLFLREAELRQAIEMLFFAYRDFTSEPDQILAQYGFGRAHHRVIYFVGRHPGITVSELLAILAITKQSLSRVLGQLVAEGFIEQRPGERDRRQRLLELTDPGRALERRLTENQRSRIARAFREAGAEAVEGFNRVLLNIIDERNRGRFDHREAPARGTAGAGSSTGAGDTTGTKGAALKSAASRR
jgi:DNA-binding MarR family transcriptional regulator